MARYSPRGALGERFTCSPEAKDRGNQCARERNADDSQSACPTVRAATPNLRCDGAETTKYPTGGVLHDFARCDEDFRRV